MEERKERIEKTVLLVEKAALPMKGNESVGDFTTALKKVVSEFVNSKLGLAGKNKASVYPIEIYSSSVIVDVYTYGSAGEYKYYSIDYKRKGNDFTLGGMTEVTRKTVWTPVPKFTIIKKEEKKKEEKKKEEEKDASVCATPGNKLRSGGKGQGLARGGGKGPIGKPLDKEEDEDKEKKKTKTTKDIWGSVL